MSLVVLGSRGLVGSALCRALTLRNIEFIPISRQEVDLSNQVEVEDLFSKVRPKVILFAAARVGGILANSRFPVEFLSDNLALQSSVLGAANKFGVERLVFLGSSCIFPRDALQPIKEEYLMTGPLEKTNEAYAIAKIAGLKLVQSYRQEFSRSWISLMPTNLYGPNDNFDLESSHVLAAFIRKFHDAKMGAHKSVLLWGSGLPKREFMYVDDFASAVLHLSENYDSEEPINVGTGEECTILELSNMVSEVVGFQGEVVWDKTKPDGTSRKLLDISKLKSLGWSHRTSLKEGLIKTYEWYRSNHS